MRRINLSDITFYLIGIQGAATECYTSNKQTKKRNDDGVLYECRMEAGASILRKCVKFTRGTMIFKPNYI